eukprot:2061161-Prymnesium_polylepis.1
MLAAGAAVVIVTHQLQFCARPQVGRVAVIRDGAIAACGRWDDVRRTVAPEMLPRAPTKALDAGDDRAGERGDAKGDAAAAGSA